MPTQRGFSKVRSARRSHKQIQRTEKEIAEKLDKQPDVLKEDGYPDVQAFMATYHKAEGKQRNQPRQRKKSFDRDSR